MKNRKVSVTLAVGSASQRMFRVEVPDNFQPASDVFADSLELAKAVMAANPKKTYTLRGRKNVDELAAIAAIGQGDMLASEIIPLMGSDTIAKDVKPRKGKGDSANGKPSDTNITSSAPATV